MTVRRPGWTSEALVTLDGLLDGPVHPPYSIDATIELALDPGLPVRALRRLIAVVGATGIADVVQVVRWAAEHDIDVVVLGTGASHGHGVRTGDRPAVALSLSRVDHVVADPDSGTVRAGVGAAWAAVHRVAADAVGRPCAALSRPGTMASTLGATTLRGATVVTGDGVVHGLPEQGCAAELWWAFRARPGAVGIVTAVVVDARYTTTVLPRTRTSPAELIRLVHLARRYDPAGLLGVPH
ncbi:FAD-binding protein [Actinomycetospora endophytica]|uniref:FAD-binding protein n=1 Tax=Actinomycetospora endophytica TaxID=2291215 RepID=A0ABS8P804_9PSEU|nr:FAD-binding protein [Actinomycetospora endophytica]MCD2194412.1 FAD-binding protein [Actinomycetospora endophytica]